MPLECIVCHSDDICSKDVKEEVKVGSDIVYVPIHVPVCGTCGEWYYDRRTMQYLEDVTQKLKAGETPLREVGKVLTVDI